jgi:hypothetical protein
VLRGHASRGSPAFAVAISQSLPLLASSDRHGAVHLYDLRASSRGPFAQTARRHAISTIGPDAPPLRAPPWTCGTTSWDHGRGTTSTMDVGPPPPWAWDHGHGTTSGTISWDHGHGTMGMGPWTWTWTWDHLLSTIAITRATTRAPTRASHYMRSAVLRKRAALASAMLSKRAALAVLAEVATLAPRWVRT